MSKGSLEEGKLEGIDVFEGPIVAGPQNEMKAPSITVSVPVTAPDGGTRAWLQVAGAFLVFGNLWGLTFAFGSFQSYYELTLLTERSPSTISWIGTTSITLLVFGGIISGPLFDRGYFRSMLIIGALVETLGLFLLSLCSASYYQIFLTQGIVMGLGNGLLYIPGLALVGRAFTKHRSMAMGITTCGAPIGGIIYTLTFERLISQLTFGWAVRVMAFIMLSSYGIAMPLLLWHVKNLADLAPGKTRKLFDASALRDLPFWSYTTSNFLLFCGYMVPFYYMASYGQIELGMTRSSANYVIVISQAASVLGRLLAAYTASRIGVMIPWIVCGLSSGILCLGWIGVKSSGAFIAYAALYGCFSGALIPLPPSVFPVVCPDIKVLGARMGMSQAVGSVASLIGPPLAGTLSSIGATGKHRNYLGLQLFGGAIMAAGGCNLIGLWLLLIKQRGLKSKLI